jgi:hypothetical protein
MEKAGSSPDVAAKAVHHALTSSRPRIRYRVGKHAKLLATLPKILPESILDALRLRMFGLSESPTKRRAEDEFKPGAGIQVKSIRPVNP